MSKIDLVTRIREDDGNSSDFLLVEAADEIERLREYSENQRVALGRRDTEIQELMDIFRHTHVACRPGQVDPPGYPDQCQECGLDIRDAIHTRIALDGQGGESDG